jgi:hypothetical protein
VIVEKPIYESEYEPISLSSTEEGEKLDECVRVADESNESEDVKESEGRKGSE